MITDFMIGPFILMYHSIADDSDDPYSVSVDSFREQISWLSDNGYKTISLSSLLELLRAKNFRALRKNVVITFDDGYKDFFLNAFPILFDYEAPATVFLVTEMLGKISSWNPSFPNVRLMSEDDVIYIKSKGISIGSHTSTHANLTLLDKNELQKQLKKSYDTLTSFGESFYAFSYPWGQWSNHTVNAIKLSGFECAVSVGERTRFTIANKYALPRISMLRNINIEQFRILLSRTNFYISLKRFYSLILNSK